MAIAVAIDAAAVAEAAPVRAANYSGLTFNDHSTRSAMVVPDDGAAVIAESPEAKFRRLAEQWRDETRNSPTIRRAVEHHAYRGIVAMQHAAVPMIIEEMERRGGFWFPALNEITGEDPVRREDWGNVKAMAAAWSAWFRRPGNPYRGAH